MLRVKGNGKGAWRWIQIILADTTIEIKNGLFQGEDQKFGELFGVTATTKGCLLAGYQVSP